MSNSIYEKTMKMCLESNNSNKRSRYKTSNRMNETINKEKKRYNMIRKLESQMGRKHNIKSRGIMKESLRDFKPNDFNEFGGAMDLPSNKSPLIYEGNYAIVVVSGSHYDPNLVAVDLICDNGVFILKQDVPENQAIRIANELIKYVDDNIYNLEVVARRNHMERSL